MNNLKYILHLFILLALQLIVFDNVQLNSYIYINIYILAIYILPYRLKNVTILLIGFFLGLFVDMANHTIGVHAAATTFIAYIRPRLLMLTSNREQIDDIQGKQKISNFAWFFKYVFISTSVFTVTLIMAEAFSFQNFGITLVRMVCSMAASIFFILLYYFIALKEKQN